MKNIKEFYIIGEPIETKIGDLHPIYIKDYPTMLEYVGVLVLDKASVLNTLKPMIMQDESLSVLLDLANELSLYEFICLFEDVEYTGSFLHDLYNQYRDMFILCFKDDVFHKIETNEEFEYYIDLIKNFNDIKHEKENPNPEIARMDELKRRLQEARGELVTFEAMFTSTLLSSSINPKDMTLYQFNKAFDRIGYFKSYNTSTLFATVSGDAEITPWYSTTKSEDKQTTITQEQLNRAKTQSNKGGLQENL